MDRISAMLAEMTPERKAALVKELEPELRRPWLPTPGPQLEAFVSKADLLLYGGAAGGGKTDLLCGLALTEHERSVIFRRQAIDLQGFWDRLLELSPVNKQQDSVKRRIVTTDGRLVETGHLDAPGSELSWQGRPHDLIGFDEGAQLTAAKVNFVMGWNRSASGKRCRVVIASNPPIGGDGQWLMEWFAPWLDPMFPNPAAPGELRWAYVIGRGDEIVSVWVDGPDPVMVDGEEYIPLSRTFIPSKLDDNPYLRDTGYRAKINAMPEPLRSQLLHGDFLAGKEDDPYQVIPTAWVHLAQERWRRNEGKARQPMLHIGVDVAQGGNDETVLAPLYGSRFEALIKHPGKATPEPPDVAAAILKHRRNDCGVTVDCTGGWGGGVVSHLKTHNDLTAYKYVASEADGGRTSDNALGFVNLRAASWWKFREALDPDSGEDVELPPDARLVAQLTAPVWKLRGALIQIESKDDLRKRLGSSTDDADAVIMAWWNRGKSLVRRAIKAKHLTQAVDDWNPLEGF